MNPTFYECLFVSISPESAVKMRSILIGRFQPVHKGHIHTIKQILDKGEDLVIVIGSSQYSHTPDNPFTGGERVMFLKRALMDEGISFDQVDIVPITDINIHPLWVAHLKSYTPYFDKAYTHNPLVSRLLKDAGVVVDETELLDRGAYSAKHVRDLIRWNNSEWESLVPEGVVKLIKEHGMDKRIQEIGETTTKR
ncbi:MAG: nicotinamide-nucleotide adenylyltransferase [Candidatus Thorarchaeota archaeon]|nr:nicotinamide-nucleotide adenylyltransferase [Candidatus Thorarchaeota archaeon]